MVQRSCNLANLYKIELGNPNLVDHLDIIGEIYAEFKNKSTIGMTGASKALHFIHLTLFVPWDMRIRECYHRNDPSSHKNHEVGSPQCYSDFMNTYNNFAIKLLEKISRGIGTETPLLSRITNHQDHPKNA